MRIFSSQIQEWIVEFGCDRLFITIRTDVAWYRLARYAHPSLLSIWSRILGKLPSTKFGTGTCSFAWRKDKETDNC